MLVKERAERERKRNNSPLLDNAMEAAWRSGGLEPLHSPSQRTATRRGDSARDSAPLAPNSPIREIFRTGSIKREGGATEF